jgi:hypothetical protein
MNKYRCPTCGFQIFNRRVRKCESCGGELPEDLLFSAKEVAAMDAEHERNRKERETQARKRKQSDSADASGYGAYGSWSGGDASDDGGGGCD